MFKDEDKKETKLGVSNNTTLLNFNKSGMYNDIPNDSMGTSNENILFDSGLFSPKDLG